jgi:hypothetical protein
MKMLDVRSGVPRGPVVDTIQQGLHKAILSAKPAPPRWGVSRRRAFPRAATREPCHLHAHTLPAACGPGQCTLGPGRRCMGGPGHVRASASQGKQDPSDDSLPMQQPGESAQRSECGPESPLPRQQTAAPKHSEQQQLGMTRQDIRSAWDRVGLLRRRVRACMRD